MKQLVRGLRFSLFALCLSLAHRVGAQVVNFSFSAGAANGQSFSGQGGLSDAGHTFWNPIKTGEYKTDDSGSSTYTGGTTTGAKYSDGATDCPITLTIPAGQAYHAYVNYEANTIGAFFEPYSTTAQTFTLENVPAGTYKLLLYGANGSYHDKSTTFTVSTPNTAAASLTATNTTDADFLKGDNYVEFTGLTLKKPGKITFSVAGTSGTESDFSGLQLQKITR